MGDESGSEGFGFVELISDISEKDISGSESYSEVQTHLPTWAKRHYLPPRKSLEILLIQEEPGLIFKEQVLISLVMIHCHLRPVI